MKDDTISRAAAIDAMMKLQTEDIEAYGASIPEGFDGDRAVAVLKALPSATDTNVGGNLIDRRVAIDALWEALYEYEDKTEKQFQESEDLDVGDWIEHRIFVQNMNDIDRQTILNLPSAQPDVPDTYVGDMISRQAAIKAFLTELTKRERKNLLHTWSTVEVKYFVADMLEKLPSAQPVNIAKLQPNCNQVASDVISRQAALDALTEWYDNDDDKRSAKDVIRELPQEQQWSCGKPKHIGRYIVTYWSRLNDDEQCRVQIMRFQNGHWVYPRHIPEWINGEIEEKVLAWCELPTPYREGGQS